MGPDHKFDDDPAHAILPGRRKRDSKVCAGRIGTSGGYAKVRLVLRILASAVCDCSGVWTGRKTCSKLPAALLLGQGGGLVGLLDLDEWCLRGEMALCVVCMRLSARWDAMGCEVGLRAADGKCRKQVGWPCNCSVGRSLHNGYVAMYRCIYLFAGFTSLCPEAGSYLERAKTFDF